MDLAREREKYLEEFNFSFCNDATKFEKLAKIGQGTFGYLSITSCYYIYNIIERWNS